MSSSRKGSRNERSLRRAFKDTSDYEAMRAPASGGATVDELPDLIAGNGTRVLAIEAKTSAGDPIYLSKEEVEALIYFATQFGADAKIAVKFNIKRGDPAWGDDENPGWYFFDSDDLYQTPGGNYRVKKEVALSDGTPFDELTATGDD